ncbi:MAG: hypothetical protein IJ899_19300, partial [Blautia sp.]|nr:hypothetical protein [Blautia sp.]
KCAQKAGIPFDVVLFDTWFSNPVQLVALQEINADVIAMIKKNSTKYNVITNSETGIKEKLDVTGFLTRSSRFIPGI